MRVEGQIEHSEGFVLFGQKRSPFGRNSRHGWSRARCERNDGQP
jgi:hypothetical protein